MSTIALAGTLSRLNSSKGKAADLIAEIEGHQRRRGGAHRAGTLTSAPLRAIEDYLRNYFAGGPVTTVETGCGASTILFAHYSKKHLAFCYDDRRENNSSVGFATSFPGFNADRVEWIFGPTQRTILSRPLQDEVDIILIDGPHGYPFPELEYFAFYPWLKTDGILILDDIHIPTIRNLYNFLSEDEMFYPHQVVGTTAFFVRSKAPALSREGDDWWLQRYNIQRFPANPTSGASGYRVPFSISYENGHLTQLGSGFTRGFIPVDGCPTTEGGLAMMRLPLSQPPAGETLIEIDVECVAPDEQPDAGFEAFVNLAPAGRRQFGKDRHHRLSLTLDPWPDPVIDIKFHVWGQKPAEEIRRFQSGTFGKRRLGVILKRISARPAAHAPAMASDDSATRQGAIVAFKCDSQAVRFFVDNPEDTIQAHHDAGRFYEWDALNMLPRHVERGVRVLDVGANGGNHTVFFERMLGASKVVPIEPLPSAMERLRLNAALNHLTRTDLAHLGIELGARRALGTLFLPNPADAQTWSIRESPTGTIPIEPGDRALQGQAFDVIRINAQGRESDVAEGLRQTIDRHRPVLFVTVRNTRRQSLELILRQWGYQVVDECPSNDAVVALVLKYGPA